MSSNNGARVYLSWALNGRVHLEHGLCGFWHGSRQEGSHHRARRHTIHSNALQSCAVSNMVRVWLVGKSFNA
jgi:hypothetical protein